MQQVSEYMITIKYKGENIDPKDIEITWVEYDGYGKDGLVEKTGDIEDYGFSKYSDGYEEGYNEGTYQDA